jgi:amino acid transporter
MREKIDKFLAYVKQKGDEKVEFERVAVKPSKAKAIIGFVVSLLFFMSCLFLLLGTVWGYVLTFISFIIMVYYGTNVFTKKGLGIYQHVQVQPTEEEEEKEQIDPVADFYNQKDEESEKDAQDRD